LVHALKVRHDMYNRELDYLSERQKDGTCMVICPEETLPIGRLSHDTNKMEMTYLLGRRAAEKFLISHSLK
jgi:predicted patatin/cPLA2 family phospholipase